MYEEASSKVMIVDFKQAEFQSCQLLSLLSPNAWNQGKQGGAKKQQKDDFTKEEESVILGVSRLVWYI